MAEAIRLSLATTFVYEGRSYVQINQSTDYAIRMVLYLARAAQPVPSSKLSEAVGVSSRYLLQIGSRLRDAGLITVLYGSNGGYTLSKAPEEITLLDIISLIERRTCFCSPTSVQRGEAVHTLDAAYRRINDILTDMLQGITIESLLREPSK